MTFLIILFQWTITIIVLSSIYFYGKSFIWKCNIQTKSIASSFWLPLQKRSKPKTALHRWLCIRKWSRRKESNLSPDCLRNSYSNVKLLRQKECISQLDSNQHFCVTSAFYRMNCCIYRSHDTLFYTCYLYTIRNTKWRALRESNPSLQSDNLTS